MRVARVRRKQPWPAAAAVASAAVHLAIVAALIAAQPRWSLQPQSHAISVDLTPLWRLPVQPRRQPPIKQLGPKSAGERPASPKAATTASPEKAAPAAAVSQAPGTIVDEARLGAALRRSGVGCANADFLKLTEAEREACRHRLADGAMDAPHLSGVPRVKAEYYAALQASEAKMNDDPMGGHGPRFTCGGVDRRLGVKIGPCKLVAPLTPFTPETDVRPP
jgi:hypothetical protein